MENEIKIRENGSMLVVNGGSYSLPVSTFSMTDAVAHCLKAGATWESLDAILQDFKMARA